MDLVAENVIAYLVERGLLASGHAARTGVVVKDVSRRNRNFRIQAGEAGFMVKQVREANTANVGTLRREASCYGMARTDRELARIMPSLLSYDASNNILVTALAAGAESLADRNIRGDAIPPMLGERLGAALGRHHARPASAFEGAEVLAPFRRQAPYILQVGETAHRGWLHLGPLAPRLGEIIRREPDLERALDAFRDQWRRDCLMHGDISWENVIVSTASAQNADLLIIDWEMADIGDSGLDTGIVLRSFLSAWLLDAQADRRQAVAGPAPPPVHATRALTLAFWSGYARARGFDAARSRLELERGMQFAALQMAFVAIEIARLDPKRHSPAIEAVEIAFRLFQNPQPPVRNLIGA